MIAGRVDADARAAWIDLHVEAGQGRQLTVSAVVDTGFTGFLTLPADVIGELALVQRSVTDGRLADGSVIQMDVYTAAVEWDGEWRMLPIYATDGPPLIGMALLHGYELVMRAIGDGEVRLSALA